jgi:hypothetical protein
MYKTVSVEDNLAIQDLLGRYCWYFDENRFEEWAALYTADGIFEGFGPSVQGTAALQEIPKATYATSKGNVRHLYSNLYLEHTIDDNAVVARYYSQVSDWSQGGKLSMMVLCTADLVRTTAGWRIRRNVARMLM